MNKKQIKANLRNRLGKKSDKLYQAHLFFTREELVMLSQGDLPIWIQYWAWNELNLHD